jgi:hypothetical protein
VHSSMLNTYDHRTLKTRLPVRSALFKQRTGGLVVRWVTTSEYPLLYVFAFFAYQTRRVSFERVHITYCLVKHTFGSYDTKLFSNIWIHAWRTSCRMAADLIILSRAAAIETSE